MPNNKNVVKNCIVYSALNCRTFQGLSRDAADEFLFGTNDQAVNMLCVIVKMYIQFYVK